MTDLQTKPWRCFFDPSYFDKWAIQHKDRQTFYETLHVCSKGEAEFITNQLNRLAELEAITIPQPIETAPKDASRILVYIPGARKEVLEVFWAKDYEEDPGHWSTPFGPKGRGYFILPEAPTHWMPLPKFNLEEKTCPPQ